MGYRVAVCEDEAALREQLCALCGEILTDLKVEHEIRDYCSAEELESEIKAGEQFQLLCLDIVLPDKSGMDLALEMRERDEKTEILFITGSTEYLLKGYEARPIRYLLKPVDRQQLEQALKTALKLWGRPDSISFRIGNKSYMVPLQEILYVESVNHGSMFHLENEERFFWLPLSQAERLLPPEQFCRCHKSFLVNMKQIREADGRQLLLANGCRVDVGMRYAADFKERFVRFLNN